MKTKSANQWLLLPSIAFLACHGNKQAVAQTLNLIPLTGIECGQAAPLIGAICTIHVPKEQFAPAEPIVLQVNIKNTSEQTQHILKKPREAGYFSLEVKNAGGAIMPNTRYGMGLLGLSVTSSGIVIGGGPSGHFEDLAAGQAISETITVNRCSDMTPVGIYTIVASCTLMEGNQKVQSVSPPVQIEVANADITPFI